MFLLTDNIVRQCQTSLAALPSQEKLLINVTSFHSGNCKSVQNRFILINSHFIKDELLQLLA